MIENTLPCPFCGSLDLDFIGNEIEGDDHHWSILCNCSITTGGYKTKEQAIAFWNKRAPVFVVSEDSDMMEGDKILGIFSSAANARAKVLERFAEINPRDTRTSIEAFENELNAEFGAQYDNNGRLGKWMVASCYRKNVIDKLGD
jgi:Lar family restriction alleviation protein